MPELLSTTLLLKNIHGKGLVSGDSSARIEFETLTPEDIVKLAYLLSHLNKEVKVVISQGG